MQLQQMLVANVLVGVVEWAGAMGVWSGAVGVQNPKEGTAILLVEGLATLVLQALAILLLDGHSRLALDGIAMLVGEVLE